MQGAAFQNGENTAPYTPQSFAFQKGAETAPLALVEIDSPTLSPEQAAAHLHRTSLRRSISSPITRASSHRLPKETPAPSRSIQRTASLPLFASPFRPSPTLPTCRRSASSCAAVRLAAPCLRQPLRMADDDVPSPSDELWASLRRRLPSAASASSVASSTDPAVRPHQHRAYSPTHRYHNHTYTYTLDIIHARP